jgi:hypothetical protein
MIAHLVEELTCLIAIFVRLNVNLRRAKHENLQYLYSINMMAAVRLARWRDDTDSLLLCASSFLAVLYSVSVCKSLYLGSVISGHQAVIYRQVRHSAVIRHPICP